MAEFSIHGSPILVRLLLAQCTSLAARHAEAGEFTYRALANGKLDLAQAEAVQELICAGSERALVLASNAITGHVSARTREWINTLEHLLTDLEVFHDYAADDLDASLDPSAFPAAMRLQSALAELEAQLTDALETSQRLLPWREGVTVAILGPPNVGKSTLFNTLLGQPRALTAPQPGTTRDYLAETLNVCGLNLSLVDTAGYRETADSVEAAGVERSTQWGTAADQVLWVNAADRDIEPVPPFLTQAQVVEVFTRCDLLTAWPATSPGKHYVSGLTGQGIAELRQLLSNGAVGTAEIASASFNRRQLGELTSAQRALHAAQAALALGLPFDAVCADLYLARRALTGVFSPDNRQAIVNSIFTRFCVGK